MPSGNFSKFRKKRKTQMRNPSKRRRTTGMRTVTLVRPLGQSIDAEFREQSERNSGSATLRIFTIDCRLRFMTEYGEATNNQSDNIVANKASEAIAKVEEKYKDATICSISCTREQGVSTLG